MPFLYEKLENEKVDITLPERPFVRGKVHPVSQTIDEISSIFSEIGFSVEEGPDVENEYNNFTALNTPDNHPARDMHDTFYLDEKKELLLRTHTSPVQVRTMLKGKPPFKIIAPGRTYRSDSDQTHAPMFHQVEGLHIDKDINMGHLKGCLNYFIKEFFEVDKLKMRFRPSHFPFTEPSAEVDIGYRINNVVDYVNQPEIKAHITNVVSGTSKASQDRIDSIMQYKTYLEKIDMTKAPDDQKNKVSALLTQFDRYLEAVK